MTIKVVVEAVGILNVNTGNDPGGNLEIYGHLACWKIGRVNGNAIVRGEFFLYNRQDPNQAQSVLQGNILPIGVKSPQIVIEPGEELWIGGHLKEQDGISENDSMGDHHRELVRSAVIEGDYLVRYQESSQIADAIFRLFVTVT